MIDTTTHPNLHSMQRIAALCNTSLRLRFYAILRQSTTLPNFHVIRLQLNSSVARCLHAGLASRSWGHGPEFLYKPLLHYVMPESVRRLIILDCDTVPLRDLRGLFEHFRHFAGSVLGVVNEQSMLYQRSIGVVGKNGGVQLLDLQAMRASALYRTALDRAATDRTWRPQGWLKGGWLGDQTLYSLLAADYPSLIYTLPCEFNRQLGSDFLQMNRHADGYVPGDPSVPADHHRFGFTNATVHTCPRRCAILHANYYPLK